MARQVKEQVYEDNKDVRGHGLAVDHGLDIELVRRVRRWMEGVGNRVRNVHWPLHPNCVAKRIIDPEDDLGRDGTTAVQIRPVEKGPTQAITPTRRQSRSTEEVLPQDRQGDVRQPTDAHSDVLARWAKDGNASLEVHGAISCAWFKAQYDRMNADPQQILQAMLTGKRRTEMDPSREVDGKRSKTKGQSLETLKPA